jgi:hypothetical protein
MTSPQRRLEESPWGQAILSGVIGFLLLTLLATNLPGSELRHQLERLVAPVRDGVGLDQAWGVFAPNPRRETLRLEAELEYPDGAVGIWHPGDGDRFVSVYRDYHWRKWQEWAHGDANKLLWVSVSRWLARSYTRHGKHPVRVTLVRYWRDLPAPGEHAGPANRWRSYPYYTLEVTPQVLGDDA